MWNVLQNAVHTNEVAATLSSSSSAASSHQRYPTQKWNIHKNRQHVFPVQFFSFTHTHTYYMYMFDQKVHKNLLCLKHISSSVAHNSNEKFLCAEFYLIVLFLCIFIAMWKKKLDGFLYWSISKHNGFIESTAIQMLHCDVLTILSCCVIGMHKFSSSESKLWFFDLV